MFALGCFISKEKDLCLGFQTAVAKKDPWGPAANGSKWRLRCPPTHQDPRVGKLVIGWSSLFQPNAYGCCLYQYLEYLYLYLYLHLYLSSISLSLYYIYNIIVLLLLYI
jgi:hypothetical protein